MLGQIHSQAPLENNEASESYPNSAESSSIQPDEPTLISENDAEDQSGASDEASTPYVDPTAGDDVTSFPNESQVDVGLTVTTDQGDCVRPVRDGTAGIDIDKAPLNGESYTSKVNRLIILDESDTAMIIVLFLWIY